MSFDDPDLSGCAALVQRADPDRFLATMAAPLSARAVLFPIYACNVEIARAPWVTKEPMIAEMRLQWWRDALEEIAAGGKARRHEVVSPLSRALDKAGAELLDKLVQARRWDIYGDPFEDAAHFEDYLQSTSSNLMLAAARALGPADEDVVRDFGYAAGLANYLCAIPGLERAKRVPLLDGRPEAVSGLAQNALIRLKRARANRARLSAPARSALLPGWTAGAILKQAASEPDRGLAGAFGQSPFARKFGLMVRATSGRW